MENIFDSSIGKIIILRLGQEQIIWLTTVDGNRYPQPRPVWFEWDEESLLILSQPNAAKVRHIQHNPRVALNFNTDVEGGSVGVLIGLAQIASAAPSQERVDAYLQKYEAGIRDLGMTQEQMLSEYSTVITVKPLSIRGF